VSQYLRDVTIKEFGVKREIDVVPNFVDVNEYRPDGASPFAQSLVQPGEQLLVHVSNFRPVKRIPDVLAIFDRVRQAVPARLLMVGDGPGRSMAEKLARQGGFEDRAIFIGEPDVAACGIKYQMGCKARRSWTVALLETQLACPESRAAAEGEAHHHDSLGVDARVGCQEIARAKNVRKHAGGADGVRAGADARNACRTSPQAQRAATFHSRQRLIPTA